MKGSNEIKSLLTFNLKFLFSSEFTEGAMEATDFFEEDASLSPQDGRIVLYL